MAQNGPEKFVQKVGKTTPKGDMSTKPVALATSFFFLGLLPVLGNGAVTGPESGSTSSDLKETKARLFPSFGKRDLRCDSHGGSASAFLLGGGGVGRGK